MHPDPTPPDVVERDDVYAPAEDSWLLLKALARDARIRGARALDVGTGSGVAALWMAREGAARVVAVDVNPSAVRLARENATRLRLALDVVRGDLFAPLAPAERFDVVTFNAPYLPSEADEHVGGWLDHAFHGGDAGVEVASRFVRDVPRRLTEGGRAFLVVSDRGDVARLAEEARGAGVLMVEAAREAFFFERILVYRLEAAP